MRVAFLEKWGIEMIESNLELWAGCGQKYEGDQDKRLAKPCNCSLRPKLWITWVSAVKVCLCASRHIEPLYFGIFLNLSSRMSSGGAFLSVVFCLAQVFRTHLAKGQRGGGASSEGLAACVWKKYPG